MQAWGWHKFHFYSPSQSKSSEELPHGSALTSSIRLSQISICLYFFQAALHTYTHMYTPPGAATEGSVPWWRGLLGIVPQPAVAVTLNTAESSSHQAFWHTQSHTHGAVLWVKTYLVTYSHFCWLQMKHSVTHINKLQAKMPWAASKSHTEKDTDKTHHQAIFHHFS